MPLRGQKLHFAFFVQILDFVQILVLHGKVLFRYRYVLTKIMVEKCISHSFPIVTWTYFCQRGGVPSQWQTTLENKESIQVFLAAKYDTRKFLVSDVVGWCIKFGVVKVHTGGVIAKLTLENRPSLLLSTLL